MITPQIPVSAASPEFWTPAFWRGFFADDDLYRQYKLERDRALASTLLQFEPEERVLEVGCGYGRLSETLLATEPSIRLVGIDRSEPMLRWCGEHLRSGFTGCRADGEALPFATGRFDAVVCTGVLMHVRNQEGTLRELCRVLKPGGRLLISANNLMSVYGPAAAAVAAVRRCVRQSFKLPWYYTRRLHRHGVRVERVAGDTLLAVRFGRRSRFRFPPDSWLNTLTRIDRWMESPPMSFFAYEVWFRGIKSASNEEQP